MISRMTCASLGLAAALGFASPAGAVSQVTMTHVTLAQLSALATSWGYKVTPDKTNDGQPFIHVSNNSYEFPIYPLDCDASAQCEGFAAAYFDTDHQSNTAFVNSFNERVPYAKVYVNSHSHAVIEIDELALGGITEAHIKFVVDQMLNTAGYYIKKNSSSAALTPGAPVPATGLQSNLSAGAKDVTPREEAEWMPRS